MIHDPIVGAVGNEQELTDAIRLLRACKDSILNVYAVRCRLSRNDVSEKMTAVCWMDAQTALANGFIDGITDGIRVGAALNAGEAHIIDRAEAEKKVQAWIDRKTARLSCSTHDADTPSSQEAEHTAAVDGQEAPGEAEGTQAIRTPVDNPVDNSVNALCTAMPKDPASDAPSSEPPEQTGTPVAQLHKRLGLIMPSWR